MLYLSSDGEITARGQIRDPFKNRLVGALSSERWDEDTRHVEVLSSHSEVLQ